mmetsp:Transcript_36005/g.56191  ORF Transcript_36005/g.56191 Transcript_36005/m.56191 type:complete len:207 (-) Transcript_36005:115-735(-)
MPIGVASEGQATTQSGRNVFYRVVGDASKEKTKVKGKTVQLYPLLVIPDKLKAHDYLEPLEAVVTSDRRAVFYDPLGTGFSDKLSAEQSKKLESDEQVALSFAVDELSELVTALKKTMKTDKFHLCGHAFGASVALAYADREKSKGSIASVSLADPPSQQPLDGIKTQKLSDPTNLCTKKATDLDREVFVKLVIDFMDEVDGIQSE